LDGYLTNPLVSDSDLDGLNDYVEFYYETNPWEKDSDFDMMNDSEEVNFGVDGYLTNPNAESTDTDALTDYWEWKNGTNPTKADTDNDGFQDHVEVTYKTNPNCPTCYPMPNLAIVSFVIRNVPSDSDVTLNFTVTNNGIWTASNIRIVIRDTRYTVTIWDNTAESLTLTPGESKIYSIVTNNDVIRERGTYSLTITIDANNAYLEYYSLPDGQYRDNSESDNSRTTSFMRTDGFWTDFISSPFGIPIIAIIIGAAGVVVTLAVVKTVKKKQIIARSKYWESIDTSQYETKTKKKKENAKTKSEAKTDSIEEDVVFKFDMNESENDLSNKKSLLESTDLRFDSSNSQDMQKTEKLDAKDKVNDTKKTTTKNAGSDDFFDF